MKYNAPRLGSTREAERTLDSLTRKIVLLQEKKCFTCSATTDLQCGHLFERRHRAIRWDVTPDGNSHAQCWPCNSLHEEEPEIYTSAFIMSFGQAAYDSIEDRSRAKHKITYSELLDMIIERETLLAELAARVSHGGNE